MWPPSQHGNTEKVNDYLLKDITVSDSEVDDYITKLTAEAKQAYEKSAQAMPPTPSTKRYGYPKTHVISNI